jgi:DNA polymerase III delta prime subunit
MTYTRQLNYLDLILRNNKLPHALLFYGADAVGIKQIVQALIFRINTPDSNWADFNIDNQLSYSIKNGSNPDVFLVKLIAGKKEIGIAQIRALKNFLSQSPLVLAKKAAIIENAECLTEEAWNALLKTLEEPSPNSIIFLISSGIRSIPKTIVSRTLVVPFNSPAISPKTAESDIIKKLAGRGGIYLYEKFDLAEKIAASGRPAEFLDEWMVALHARLESNSNSQENIIFQIKLILKTKGLISKTNANPKLMLERLILETHV